MALIVYFSTKSRNTHRFVSKLNLPLIELPHAPTNDTMVSEPFVLVTPTYGGGYKKGAVPPVVIRFLNEKQNRDNMLGVISTGNTNFGDGFCQAGRIISSKCGVPNIADIELFGTQDDVDKTKEILNDLFNEEEHD